MKKSILLVEDEENLLKTIRMNLELEGFEVISAIDGLSAVEIWQPYKFDLIILDVMLPGIDGFAVCEAIRKKDRELPILFLTAKSHGEDKIRGLKLGADDYLTKPFHLEEFLLRVHNLVKRSKRQDLHLDAPRYQFGDNTIDFATFEASGKGKSWQLSKREIDFLKLLIEREGQVVSRDVILEELWKDDEQPTARAIDNYILNFRKYFEENAREPRHFFSIRGVGYKFVK